ncbi:unnamed protein product, partial [Didymodactylos carnosus]
TTESDSEYLVDTKNCRTTVKCKRKSLKKTIKLIHGRCVVIYRGSGDLLPIAAKDADRNCYCDFVFVVHDKNSQVERRMSPAIPRTTSALKETRISEGKLFGDTKYVTKKTVRKMEQDDDDSVDFHESLDDDDINENVRHFRNTNYTKDCATSNSTVTTTSIYNIDQKNMINNCLSEAQILTNLKQDDESEEFDDDNAEEQSVNQQTENSMVSTDNAYDIINGMQIITTHEKYEKDGINQHTDKISEKQCNGEDELILLKEEIDVTDFEDIPLVYYQNRIIHG